MHSTRPESPVFKGIAPLDLRYFNDNKGELPAVCKDALIVKRGPQLEVLAKHINVHGYIKGEMAERAEYMSPTQGTTLVNICQGGTLYLCWKRPPPIR